MTLRSLKKILPTSSAVHAAVTATAVSRPTASTRARRSPSATSANTSSSASATVSRSIPATCSSATNSPATQKRIPSQRGWAVSQHVRMLQRAYAATRATAAAVQPLCCRDAAGQRCRAAAMRRNAARQRRDIAMGQDNAAASPWEEPHIMRTSPHGECPVVVVLRCSSRFGVRVSNVCGFLPKISL